MTRFLVQAMLKTHINSSSSVLDKPYQLGSRLLFCKAINNLQLPNAFSERCRNTLRGHADSVNSVEFLPFSNTLCTCSADKTISLWDARTGLCAQTLYEHQHAINHVSFNLQVSRCWQWWHSTSSQVIIYKLVRSVKTKYRALTVVLCCLIVLVIKVILRL